MLKRLETGIPLAVPEIARQWLDSRGAAALATVVSTWGSAPVPAGSQMAIAPDGSFEGSVSGGCVEAEVIAQAVEAIAAGGPRLLRFDIADPTAWEIGLPCGGAIQVFVEPLQPARDGPFLDAVLAAAEDRRALFVATDLATGERSFGAAGDLPDHLRPLAHKPVSRVAETGGASVFFHPLLPAIRLVIVGATHIGQHLTGLAANLGYRVSVVDPRSAFSTDERFGGTERLTEWPEAALEALQPDFYTALVILSHIAAIDDEALTAALRSDCLYIGALGSRRTHAARLERLKAKGFSDGELARIHAPIGLPIGALGPAEIAVSILAEIVQTVREAA